MGKKTITGTKNVYELAQERLKVIFNEFDNIYVSFSGGKDSGVLLNMCIDYIRRNNLKIRFGVFHMDYEIQYKMTIDYVDSIPCVRAFPGIYVYIYVPVLLAALGG